MFIHIDFILKKKITKTLANFTLYREVPSYRLYSNSLLYTISIIIQSSLISPHINDTHHFNQVLIFMAAFKTYI